MVYSEMFRERMLQKMLGPDAVSAAALSREVGIHQSTLSRWRREKTKRGSVSSEREPGQGPRRRRKRAAKEKIRIVMEAGALKDEELGAFLRREGLHEVELEELRQEVMKAAEAGLEARPKRGPSPEQKELQKVKKELARKEKALAETAALLVLRGKLEAFLSGDEEGDTNKKSES